ncbi:MAG: motility associated factor glycosyltransferase family protein [Candidatus Riflebacteria bacterium]|nr:motility associated factor glycosyltransferase family protein [Candidatus Riflebacteria bacterium]
MKSNVYASNMRCLRRRHPILAKIIEMDDNNPYRYIVENAKNESPTLAIEAKGKRHQIHSKYDPQKEALQQVKGLEFKNPKLAVLFGLGLAYHVRAFLTEFTDTNLFTVVIEKDVEALRTAVSTVDMTDLFESDKIRWAIGVPEEDGFAVMSDLIKQSGVGFQLFLKTLVVFDHPAISKVHGEYSRNMLRQFREAAHTIIFNYGNCPKDSLVGVENIMKNLSTIMRNPGIKDMKDHFRGLPGIVVSTGPSLDKNIEELKASVGKCVMFAADSALRVLLRHGIRPHAVATLERVIEVAKLFEDIPLEDMQNVYLAATPVIMREVYDAWKGPNIVVYRSFAHFDWLQMPKGTLQIGPSCSNMAFKLLEYMGCNPIILVGQDCSFQSLEKTHANGANSVTTLGLKQEQLFKVRGNTQEWVYTDTIFDLFLKNFVTDVATYKGTCINSTEGGAYIEGTKLMPLRESIAKYCQKEFDAKAHLKKYLHYPTEKEIQTEWKRFHETMVITRREVKNVIEFCTKGEQLVNDFEDELNRGKYNDLEDFLSRFPDDRINQVHAELTVARGKVILFGKYFNLYLMHIVQMIIVKFEMDFNELPSICEDEKRYKLQAIRMMKRWFPTIGDVCIIALKLLEDAYEELTKEFGEENSQ